MENQNLNYANYPQDENPVVSPNSLQGTLNNSGIYDAINEENYLNQNLEVNHVNSVLGDGNEDFIDNSIESDEYNDFIEEEIVPKKKRKKYNNPKEKINSLTSKIEKERAEKEEALIRFEFTQKENQRLKDENEFLALHHQKENLEKKEEELSQMWKIAHAEGDLDSIQDITKDFNKITQLKEIYERDIESVKSRYQTNYEEEQEKENSDLQLSATQQEAIEQFCDIRELSSPLNDGFLRNHSFLDPRDLHNYDANLVSRVEPIKYELIQELKLNGQADEIGTTDYYTELSMRIHENLNPRYMKRDNNMRNNRFQEPDYGKVRSRLDQQAQSNYSPTYQPQQMPYQPSPNYQPQQMPYQPNPAYQPQQMPYQQQTVAPVNRAGYSMNYMNDPNNIQLDDLQQDAADLFGSTINDLTRAVYGRSTNRDEIHQHYKQGLIKLQNGGR